MASTRRGSQSQAGRPTRMRSLRSGTPSAQRGRRGLTLIELLMVIFILVILVAATLPFVRPALQGRKIREAARQVNVYFAMAQAMAAEKGRPVGVWITRSEQGDVNGDGLLDAAAGQELFMAEVMPPYTGDIIGATCIPSDLLVSPAMDPPRTFVANPMAATPDGLVDHILLDERSLFMLDLVRPGDIIQFDNKGPTYVISAVNNWVSSGPPPYVPMKTPPYTHSIEISYSVVWNPGLDAAWGAAGVDDDNDGSTDNITERGFAGTDDYYLTNPPLPAIGAPVTYQIQRGPVKSGVSPLVLPPGTAIDLYHSGIGAVGQEFRPDNVAVVASGVSGPILDTQPVIVMFQPTGEIRSIHQGLVPRNGSGEATGGAQLIQYAPLGPVHLLVGETDKFVQAEAVDPSNAAEVAFFANNNVDQNLAGTDSLWISINERTGAVTSSENGWQTAATFIDSMFRAREFARTSQTVGGQ